jgi:hypothetical protein
LHDQRVCKRIALSRVKVVGQEKAMDFIEPIFGISLDGGDGSFEFLLFAIPIVGIAYLMLRRRARPSSPNTSPLRT